MSTPVGPYTPVVRAGDSYDAAEAHPLRLAAGEFRGAVVLAPLQAHRGQRFARQP